MNWQCRKLHTIGSNRTKCKQLTTRWRERLWTRSQTPRARWRERLWTNSRTNRCRDTWAKRQTREHRWSKHTETVMVHSNPLNYYGKLWCLRTRLVCFFYSLIIESSHEQSNSPHEHEQIHNPWETMTLHNGHVSKEHVSVSRGLSLISLPVQACFCISMFCMVDTSTTAWTVGCLQLFPRTKDRPTKHMER
jgi:hypothetical protein